MKVKRIALFGLIFSLFAFYLQACSKSFSQESKEKSLVSGVWEYMLDNHEGMGIYSNNHFIHFAIPKRDSSEKSALTDSNRVDIFRKMIALAGTYTVSDTIVTCTVTYHKNPSQIGTSFRYSLSLDGDVGTFRIINDAGEVIQTGKARKIE